MASHGGLTFDGATSHTDVHDSVQAQAGTATWVPEFDPVVEGRCKFIAEALLWLLHSFGLCGAIAGEFASYMAGKLASQPEVLGKYVAYHAQMESPDINILLQRQRALLFSLGFLNFQFEERFSTPCSTIFYTVRFRDVALAVRIKCVDWHSAARDLILI